MTQRESLTAMVGQPNPELERVTGPQKVFLSLFVVGFIFLVGLLAYLPKLGTALN